MIICFAGTPGSCKTLEAVRRICDDLRRGKRVYTNIDGMGDDECREAIMALTGLSVYELHEKLFHVSGAALLRYWETCKPNSVIYFDEIHKWLNCRDWDKATNKDFNNMASTHRHEGYNIIFITQAIDKVDKQTRGLVEWTYFFRKNNFFGSLVQKKYFRYTYAGDQHDGKPLKTSQLTMFPEYYKCYKSYSAGAKGEIDFETNVNILKHPIMLAVPLVLGFTIYSFCNSGFAKGDILSGSSKKVTSKTVAPPPSPPPAPVASPLPQIATAPPPPPMPIIQQRMSSNGLVASTTTNYVQVKGSITIDKKKWLVLLNDGRMIQCPRPYAVGSRWIE